MTRYAVRTEQPPYSILNREIERQVLPACRRYGMGTLTWSPLAGGLTLDDEILNQIDEIVPPGTDIGAGHGLPTARHLPRQPAAPSGRRTRRRLSRPLPDD